MKNQVLTSMIAVGFAALLGSTPAAAQSKQTATIPFTFEIAGVEYPEGNYSVQTLTQKVVKITNLATGRAMLVNTPVISGKTNESGSSKLVFTNSGDHLRLSQVQFAGLPAMMTADAGKEVSAKVTVGLK